MKGKDVTIEIETEPDSGEYDLIGHYPANQEDKEKPFIDVSERDQDKVFLGSFTDGRRKLLHDRIKEIERLMVKHGITDEQELKKNKG